MHTQSLLFVLLLQATLASLPEVRARCNVHKPVRARRTAYALRTRRSECRSTFGLEPSSRLAPMPFR